MQFCEVTAMSSITLFQTPETSAVYYERLAIVLGITVLVFGLSTFLSCRVCISWFSFLGVKNLARKNGYSSFYKYHTYYWWAFGVSLVAHILVATLHTGLPQAGDPDAGVHWIILASGLLGGVSAASVFSSCRVLPRLLAMLTPDKPLNQPLYRSYYKYHAYFWLVWALVVAAHFTTSYNHAGLWPPG